MVYTDKYPVYTEYFPPEYLIQSKKYTSAIERNNDMQRNRLSMFVRRSKSTSRSLTNLHKYIGIFAMFSTYEAMKPLYDA